MNPQNRFSPTRESVSANYHSVLERIQSAAMRSGRIPGEIQVIGVTKYVDAKTASWLFEAGCTHFGESKPQLLWEKEADLSHLAIDWHLIGHLQRNKVKKTIPLISTLHSLDSMRLLLEIQKSSDLRSVPLKMLLELNVTGDPDKTGMLIPDAEKMLQTWKETSDRFPMVSIVGLMGMGGLEGGADRARQDFETLRSLRDQWQSRYELPLKELSMGMSDDFEVAIQEGATMVRIGSILFQ